MLRQLAALSVFVAYVAIAVDLYNSPSFETEELYGQQRRPVGNRVYPNGGYGQGNGYGQGQNYGGYGYRNGGLFGGYWPYGYGNGGYGQQQGGQFPNGNGGFQGSNNPWLCKSFRNRSSVSGVQQRVSQAAKAGKGGGAPALATALGLRSSAVARAEGDAPPPRILGTV